MKIVISCEGVSKVFNKVVALNGVSIELAENKIYGLLGRNGAGKTTLLKIIANQLFPTEGSVKVYGENPYNNEEVLRKICFVRENMFSPVGDFNFKVKDILDTGKDLYVNWDKDFAQDLLEKFMVDKKRKYKSLSKGMQSSVAIIIGLASRAPITIFDEPYLGLDASMRERFYEILLDDYTEHPRTIVFSSHLIDECSSLFEDVIILDHGKVLLYENVDTIKAKSFYIIGRKEKVESYLRGKKVLGKKEMGRLVSAAVFSALSHDEKKTMEMDDIEVQPMSLQKLFVYLTSKNGGENNE